MAPRLFRQAVRHLLGWSIVIFFVVLLTLIFSFLGTIICAALAGMMIGAARLRRWQALLISLIFPAVIFGVLRTSGAALSLSQVLVLALLCLSAFWLIYSVMSVILRLEQPARLPGGAVQACGSMPKCETGAGASPDSMVASGRLDLEALQGRWHPEPNGNCGNGTQRVLEITAGQLRLSLTDAEGDTARCLCARLRLSAGNSLPLLSLSLPDGLDETAETLICI